MQEIRPLHIRLLDVTVILVFLGLMRNRKTTIVAEELGVTQPAISHALKRLRTIYRDPLFIRVPHGLEPTSVAKELEPLLQSALDTLAKSLREPGAFDPSSSSEPLRIAGCDFVLGEVLPKFLAETSDLASEMPIRAIRLSSETDLAELDDDSADLALGYFCDRPEQYFCETLFADECCLIAEPRHPALASDASPEFIAGQPFIAVGGTSLCDRILDEALSGLGLRRHCRASAPLVHPVASALASSECLAAVPMRIAETLKSRYGLGYRKLPFESNEANAIAAWHARNEKNPMIAWVLPHIRASFE
ncbi:MAG: LysR family transcriptional regulator [Albidovulum sp.]|nr:LysR family transcriptional regulator [Albidovulum sp.]